MKIFIISSVKDEIFISSLEAKDRDGAILEILKAIGLEDIDGVFKAVKDREEVSSTLVGRNTAIPHARTSSVDKLVYAVAKSGSGIEWDKNGKANIIVLTLSPVNAIGEHVVFLSHVARILEDDEKVKGIMEAESTKEMEEVFSL